MRRRLVTVSFFQYNFTRIVFGFVFVFCIVRLWFLYCGGPRWGFSSGAAAPVMVLTATREVTLWFSPIAFLYNAKLFLICVISSGWGFFGCFFGCGFVWMCTGWKVTYKSGIWFVFDSSSTNVLVELNPIWNRSHDDSIESLCIFLNNIRKRLLICKSGTSPKIDEGQFPCFWKLNSNWISYRKLTSFRWIFRLYISTLVSNNLSISHITLFF